MTIYYKCDNCDKAIKKEEVFGKALTFKGLSWRGYGTKYTHRHYCEKCFNELFKEKEVKKK